MRHERADRREGLEQELASLHLPTHSDRYLETLLNGLERRIDISRRHDFNVGPNWPIELQKLLYDVIESWRSGLQTDNCLLHLVDSKEGDTGFFDTAAREIGVLSHLLHAIEEDAERDLYPATRFVFHLRELAQSLNGAVSQGAHGARSLLILNLSELLERESQRMKKEIQHPYVSPLSIVTKDKTLNGFLGRLESFVTQARDAEGDNTFVLDDVELEEVRERYKTITLEAESALHQLGSLLSTRYLGPDWLVQSQVCIERPSVRGVRRAVFSEPVLPHELLATTDLEFAQRALREYDGKLIYSLYDYSPDYGSPTRYGTQHVRTRVKTPESVITKIADQVMRIDSQVGGKKIDNFTVYLKDVCGIAIIVENEAQVRRVYEDMMKHRWSDGELEQVGLQSQENVRHFQLFEVKDKLGKSDKSWRGIKFACFWKGTCFEIQIKTEQMLFREQAHHTEESHSRYKAKREELRRTFSESESLFPFVRDLLVNVFIDSEAPIRTPPNVRVRRAS